MFLLVLAVWLVVVIICGLALFCELARERMGSAGRREKVSKGAAV